MRCFQRKEKRSSFLARSLARLSAGLLGCVLLYAVLVLVLGVIPTAGNTAAQGVRIAVCGTSAHTDFTLPVKAFGLGGEQIDWTSVFPMQAAKGKNFVTIGWGQKEFFLTTPTWGDLRLTTTLRAIVGAPSVLRVYYETTLPPQSAWCRHVTVSAARYSDLARYIRQELQQDAKGSPVPVAAPEQGLEVRFYEGKSLFHAFKTCNTWTLGGIKAAGLPASLWTPLAYFILYHLP